MAPPHTRKFHPGVVDYLRQYGLRVKFVSGWQTRGNRSSYFNPRGHVCHHDAIRTRWTYPPNILVNGRSDLSGPLCNFALEADGDVWMVAAGPANHAGYGGWNGLYGNSSVWGTEAQNSGTGQPWPKAQIEAYALLCKASLAYSRENAVNTCYHREWSTQGKIDPWGPWAGGGAWTTTGGHWRRRVAAARPHNEALFDIRPLLGESMLIWGTYKKSPRGKTLPLNVLCLPGGGSRVISGRAAKSYVGPAVGKSRKRLAPATTKKLRDAANASV